MSNTFERLGAILHKDYAIEPEQLTMESTLEGLDIDSLGVVELLFTVEEEFKLQLPSEPVPMHSVGDVVRYVDQLLAAQAQQGGVGAAMAGQGALSAGQPA